MDAASCAAESHAMRRKSALVQTPQRASALMGQATFDRSYKLKGKERPGTATRHSGLYGIGEQ